jgi:hypothetical protein
MQASRTPRSFCTDSCGWDSDVHIKSGPCRRFDLNSSLNLDTWVILSGFRNPFSFPVHSFTELLQLPPEIFIRWFTLHRCRIELLWICTWCTFELMITTWLKTCTRALLCFNTAGYSRLCQVRWIKYRFWSLHGPCHTSCTPGWASSKGLVL